MLLYRNMDPLVLVNLTSTPCIDTLSKLQVNRNSTNHLFVWKWRAWSNFGNPIVNQDYQKIGPVMLKK